VIETAPHHAGEVTTLARRLGFGRADTVKDLAGRDRMLVAGRDGREVEAG
jgi:hypothetical protein